MSDAFTVMVTFNAPVIVADTVRAAVYEAFMNLLEDGYAADNGNIQMVRGTRITKNDIVESNAIADEADMVRNAGFNSNPLPEGFPTE